MLGEMLTQLVPYLSSYSSRAVGHFLAVLSWPLSCFTPLVSLVLGLTLQLWCCLGRTCFLRNPAKRLSCLHSLLQEHILSQALHADHLYQGISRDHSWVSHLSRSEVSTTQNECQMFFSNQRWSHCRGHGRSISQSMNTPSLPSSSYSSLVST